MAEQRFRKPQVSGSSPEGSSSPMKKRPQGKRVKSENKASRVLFRQEERLLRAGRSEDAVLRLTRSLPAFKGEERAIAQGYLAAAYETLMLSKLAREYRREAERGARSQSAQKELRSLRRLAASFSAPVVSPTPHAKAGLVEAGFVEELLTSILQDIHGNANVLDRVVASYERLDKKYPGNSHIQRRLAQLREQLARLSAPTHADNVSGGEEGLLAEFATGLGLDATLPHGKITVPPPSRETSEQRYRRLKESLTAIHFEKPSEVLAEVHRAVSASVAPDDFETAYNLGLAYRDMGALDGAIDWFLRAQASPRRYLQATFLLATCQAERGDRHAAIAELREALQTQGRRPVELLEIKYLLAELLRSGGQSKEAAALYKEVSEVNPNFRDVAARLASSS